MEPPDATYPAVLQIQRELIRHPADSIRLVAELPIVFCDGMALVPLPIKQQPALAPAPKPPCEYLNTAQAAELAGKTAATIRRWAKLKLIELADLPDRDGKPQRIYTIPTEAFKRWLKDDHINVPEE
jgi:hypothetical protein